MPDLSLREKIANHRSPFVMQDDRRHGYETARHAFMQLVIEHERDLISKIKARKYSEDEVDSDSRKPLEIKRGYEDHNDLIDGILALIKPTVKDPVTNQQCDPRAGHLKPTRSETEILDFVRDGIRAEGHDPDAPVTPRDERPARDERAWLVERYINGTLYFLSLSLGEISRDGVGYTSKVNDALRFARETDAWNALTYIAKGEGRVAEHAWMIDAAADRIARALEERK